MPKRKRYLDNGGKPDIGTVNGMPVIVNGQPLTTEECALFANQALRDAGYMAQGNAWNSKGSDIIFNGYDTLQRPEQYDSLAVLNYNDAASDRVYKDFDSATLDKSRPYMVNMYYKGSPYLKEAYTNGTQGRTGTHTGYLVHDGKQWNVVHNIHGKAHVDKFTTIQGGKRKYGVTSVFAPRKNSIINNIRTRLGFRNGGKIKQNKGISDSQYYNIMRKVANDNYKNWGFDNPTDAYNHAINDRTYDYRGYYNKYPNGQGNAIDHWTDEFKTVYHPLFSDESIYSGKVHPIFNPNGFTGGMWLNDIYIPPKYQSTIKLRFGSGGRLQFGGGGKSRYWVDDASILPELLVTPKGNSIVRDEAGNPAITAGAIRDINPNAKIYEKINKELKDNQYTTLPTKEQVKNYADVYANAISPTIGDMIEGTVGKVSNLLTPSHYIGAVKNWDKNKGILNIFEDNPGVVSQQYANEHPFLALGANTLADIGVFGGAKGIKEGIRIGRNIKDRNKFVYKYLEPAGYDEPYARGKNVIKHILKDKSFKKGEIPEPTYTKILENRSSKSFASFRDEAFRKYLGLPERLGLYIPNGDGTYRYSREAVKNIEQEFYGLLSYLQFMGNSTVPQVTRDFITGNGGNVLMNFVKRENGRAYWNMEDVWDLNPFESSKYVDGTIRAGINNAVRNTANKIYTNMYDKVYKHKIPYDYLGGRALNNLRYGFDISKHKLLNNLLNKVENYEVGKILGGKPFKMKTPLSVKIVEEERANPFNSKLKIKDTYVEDLNYKDGGSIHIAPSKRGTFTAAATRHGMGVQEFANTVLRNKDRYSPSLIKKANFARNASKWNH